MRARSPFKFLSNLSLALDSLINILCSNFYTNEKPVCDTEKPSHGSRYVCKS